MAMYKEFFGMKHTPFVRGIPVNALYSDAETDEVNARLLSAAKNQSFALLVGDSGMGKTTAIRRMRNGLSESEYTTLYLADSNLTPRALYSELLEQLGCPTKFQRIAARKALHREAEIMRGVGQHKLVVIVDESHLLDRKMLEEIRFLLNTDMDSRNPMALILCGQTELWDKLHTQAYRAIWERVEIHAILQPYDLSQTKAYIQTQLEYSGFQGSIFSEDSQKLIFEYTSGVPRLINNVCRNSLIYAYQNRRTIIDDKMVQQVIDGET
jgi:type II secretory pathway predicted ATPase ExeA